MRTSHKYIKDLIDKMDVLNPIVNRSMMNNRKRLRTTTLSGILRTFFEVYFVQVVGEDFSKVQNCIYDV